MLGIPIVNFTLNIIFQLSVAVSWIVNRDYYFTENLVLNWKSNSIMEIKYFTGTLVSYQNFYIFYWK
jgi:hypothetical protein